MYVWLNGINSFFTLILMLSHLQVTLPKTNIAPENKPSQKETHLPTIHFQVQAVSFREGNEWQFINSFVTSPFQLGHTLRRPQVHAAWQGIPL